MAYTQKELKDGRDKVAKERAKKGLTINCSKTYCGQGCELRMEDNRIKQVENYSVVTDKKCDTPI